MRRFKLVGPGGGEPENGFLTIVTTDVTDLYGSSQPLIASRRLHKGDDYLDICEWNQERFINPDTWTVSLQGDYPREKVGIRGFKTVNMVLFEKYWRRPVRVKEELNLVKDTWSGQYIIVENNVQHPFYLVVQYEKDTLEWLYKYDPLVYIFTDEDRMFIDPQDELAYIGDVLNREE